MKNIAIIQSNYIPWKGYFDIINLVDEFVFYDTAIYTARTWRNRNRIKTPQGPQWLVIPVHHDYTLPDSIRNIQVVDQHWRKKHWKNLVQNYTQSPFFKDYRDIFESLYLEYDETYLSDINYRFIVAINEILGITTRLTRLTDYDLSGDKDNDLIHICKKYGATNYLSGPVGKSFLQEDKFKAAGIGLQWMDYEGYPEYAQFYPPFTHELSILDLLFNTGPQARNHMKSFAVQHGR